MLRCRSCCTQVMQGKAVENTGSGSAPGWLDWWGHGGTARGEVVSGLKDAAVVLDAVFAEGGIEGSIELLVQVRYLFQVCKIALGQCHQDCFLK